MDLEEVQDELIAELQEGVTIVASDHPIGVLGDTFDTLCDAFAGLGLCRLLTRADVELFRIDLTRAAQARVHYLRRMVTAGLLHDRHLALSRVPAAMDALVAGNLALAREVAALSPAQYLEQREYEEDHCWFLGIHRLTLDPASRVGDLADRMDTVQGEASPRSQALRALEARDRPGLLAALESLLDEEQARLDAARDSAAVHEGEPLHWPHSFVSIEGLALLQVGDLCGLQVRDAGDTRELARCPPLARVPLDNYPFDDLLEEVARAS